MLVLTMELRYPVCSGGDGEMLRRMVRRGRLCMYLPFGLCQVTSEIVVISPTCVQVSTVLWATSTLMVTWQRHSTVLT